MNKQIQQLNKPSWCEGIKSKGGKPLGLRIFSENTSFHISDTIEKKIQVRDMDFKTGKETGTFSEGWTPIWIYDVETINRESLAKEGLFSSRIKVQFVVKPNDLTYIIRDGSIYDFNVVYRFKGKDITQAEFDELKNDLNGIQITKIKGNLDNVKTRPITPLNWIDKGKSNKITLIGTTVKETKANGDYQQISQTKLGKHSITFTYRGSSVTYGTVTSDTDPARTWLDKNLGATDVATAYNDSSAYGHLFQWGRLDDGHQLRDSGTTETLSSTDDPGHSNFILAPDTPYDWRDPQNDDLWNSPDYDNLIASALELGYRVPTQAEWAAELAAWSSTDYDGAYASPLKLTAGGYRNYSGASLDDVGSSGRYWSSTVAGTSARRLLFLESSASMGNSGRAYGFSVRLIYDASLAPTVAPTVTTQAVTSIGKITATGNGNITDDGGATATRGMCWDTSSAPVITDSHATNGTGEGAYTVAMTSLDAGTKYYVRAYATNSEGTSYGSEVNFTTLEAGYTSPLPAFRRQ